MLVLVRDKDKEVLAAGNSQLRYAPLFDWSTLVALVRMIQDLWARVSKMWLLGELGILLFCSPGFWDVGGLLRALSLSSPGG